MKVEEIVNEIKRRKHEAFEKSCEAGNSYSFTQIMDHENRCLGELLEWIEKRRKND